MMRMFALGALLLTLVLLETVVAPAVAVLGVPPDLTVLAVVGIALSDGPDTGARFGFTAGFARDLLVPTSALMGPWALAMLLVGFVVGSSRSLVAGSGLGGHALTGAAAALVAWLISGLLSLVLQAGAVLLGAVVLQAVIAGVWGLFLAPLVSRAARALSQRTATASPPT